MSALPSEELERTTGVLGEGGAADLRARGTVPPVPPVTPPQT
ncbi:hypothetical protein ACGFNQ_27845 [Streptomyces asoensis]